MKKELDLIGKTLEQAATILNDASVSFRLTRRDGQYYIVTQDYRPERVNLQVDNGLVTSYNHG